MSKFSSYFQISFLVIYAGVAIIKSYQLSRKNIRPLALWRNGFANGIIETIYLAINALWIFEFIIYSLNAKSLFYPAFFHIELFNIFPAKIIGFIFLVIGLVMFTWSQVSFRDSWRVGTDNSNYGELVTTGIFSASRNPIYVAIALFYIASVLINGTVIFLIMCLFMLPTLHVQVIGEEHFLLGVYGQRYRDYCSRVNRYFTWR